MRRSAFIMAIGVSMTALPLGCSPRDESASRAPNVFVIVVDAAAAEYFGCYGDKTGTSPVIDALAREGVLFENAYSQTPTTVTSTASLMTGVRATTHLMTDTTVLDKKFKTLPEVLSSKGMKCYGVIGNPFAGAPATGLNRGYDELIEVYALEELQKTRSTEESSHFRVTLPEDINEQFFKLIPKIAPSGTFAYIHYLQPHKPYTPPESKLREYDCHLTDWKTLHREWLVANQAGRADESTIRGLESRYRATIRYVDESIGRLLDRLKSEGLYDESLIVLKSDHGEAFFKHRLFGHNATLYDDMMRVPLIIKFPKSTGIAPRRIANPVETIDVLPTLCEFLKVSPPDQHEGDSLWGLITGGVKELPGPEVVTCTIQRSKHALRVKDFKYIHNRGGVEELYDLRHDPHEQKNLAKQDVENTRRMREMLLSIVDVNAGRGVVQSNKLREDPRMKALVESLGYSGAEIDDEFQHAPDGAPTNGAAPAATQPAETSGARDGPSSESHSEAHAPGC